MAKIVVVCLRNPSSEALVQVQRRVARFLDSICPDNLTPASPVVASDGAGLCLGVLNPADPAAVHGCSAYVGWLADAQDTWWHPGGSAPSGSYAIFRASPALIELVADAAGSRTIWFAQTEDVFVASTSQRAIPYFLGSFEPNPMARAWMLSCGTLGPGHGWDRRARPLAPGGTARFDRNHWQLTTREPAIEFRAEAVSDDVHAFRLNEALQETFGNLRLDFSRWVLPLSGGFDSRAILLLLRNRAGLRTVTWGRADALDQRGNDAYVAREVARTLGVEHRYFATDLSDEPVDTLLDRYLVAGDGRTDGILAYMDGFRTWRSLFDDGVRGIIRGDHGFGPGPCPPLRDHVQAMHFDGLPRWQDHKGLPSFEELGLAELEGQRLPDSLEPLGGETPEVWRDRLYLAYRVPVYHAGQSDLKSAYVEIASPFFVKRVLDLTRTLPEHLRNGKTLFRRVVESRDVAIPFATEPALVPSRKVLAEAAIRDVVCDELASQFSRQLFSGKFADLLLNAWSDASLNDKGRFGPDAVRRQLRLWFPRVARSRVRREIKTKHLDLRWVAVRAFLASRMHQRLTEDGIQAEKDRVNPHRRAAAART